MRDRRSSRLPDPVGDVVRATLRRPPGGVRRWRDVDVMVRMLT